MAEAAKPSTSAASKVFPATSEQSDFTCGVCCRQVTEQRILSCRHYFCAECIERIRSTAEKPKCPSCRERISTPAICYPLILKDDKPQEEDIKKEITCEIHCQVERCKRSVDFYCQPCKMFICYRCRKSNKCAHSEGLHAAVEIGDLLPLAKEMFADWEKKKQIEIEKLHSEITQVADNFKELVGSDDNSTGGKSQEMVQLSQQLHNLTVQKAEELVPLEYYRGNIEKMSETALIQLVEHMSTDHSNRRTESADQYINNISMSKGSSSIEENIVKHECPTSDQPEQPVARNEASVPETSNSSSARKKVIRKDDDDYELSSREFLLSLQYDDDGLKLPHGYLLKHFEAHKSTSCKYTRAGVKPQRINLPAGSPYMEVATYVLVRHCVCFEYENGGWETHYSRVCKWQRLLDRTANRVQLARICQCQKPLGLP